MPFCGNARIETDAQSKYLGIVEALEAELSIRGYGKAGDSFTGTASVRSTASVDLTTVTRASMKHDVEGLIDGHYPTRSYVRHTWKANLFSHISEARPCSI